MNVIRQLPVKQGAALALAECLNEETSSSKSANPAVDEHGTDPRAAQSPMRALIRSKGFVWLSNSHSQIFYWAVRTSATHAQDDACLKLLNICHSSYMIDHA